MNAGMNAGGQGLPTAWRARADFNDAAAIWWYNAVKHFLLVLLAALLLAAAPRPAVAAPLKTLTWGGDAEGGAPYVFQDPNHPERLIGFEVDIARALAARLHCKQRFVQNEWDGLVLALKRGDFDIAMNGIEITKPREREVNFTIPYYATTEQISVRKSNTTIHNLNDLRGKAVGTLKASLAQHILDKMGGVHVVLYDGQINAYEDLVDHRIDAVLLDWPIAIYYGKPLKQLKFVGKPVGYMEYGIAVRKRDTALLRRLNIALLALMRNGTLEKIYKKWGLWNIQTKTLFARQLARPRRSELSRFTHEVVQHESFMARMRQYVSYLPMLLGVGVPMTFAISLCGMAVAVSVGLIAALMKLYAPRPIAFLARAYIELVRGTPLLIQLYLIYYGLPSVGIRFSPFVAAVLGLGLNYAAYEAENYRAGIQSVPRGQMEASRSLGMTQFQALRHVIVPQAIRVVIPPVTNDFISLLKDSSIVSVITMVELTKVYSELASVHYDYIGLGLMTAGIYFIIGLPFVYLARYLERRLAVDKRSGNGGGKSGAPGAGRRWFGVGAKPATAEVEAGAP